MRTPHLQTPCAESPSDRSGAVGNEHGDDDDDPLIACDPIGSWRYYIQSVPVHRPPRPPSQQAARDNSFCPYVHRALKESQKIKGRTARNEGKENKNEEPEKGKRKEERKNIAPVPLTPLRSTARLHPVGI